MKREAVRGRLGFFFISFTLYAYMIILGISCYYHDAAAAIIKDGKIAAAAEEERFSRKKHDSGFPKKAIEFCLKTAKIKSSDIDYVVFYEKPFRKFHRILISTISTYPKSYPSFREAMRIWLSQKLWIKQEIVSYFDIDLNHILFCEHHLSHAASCFFPSPFEKSAILTIDGVGEWTTASWGIGDGNKITLNNEIHYPQSLGLFYSTYTAFLGFEVNEGEWKVMGLAPYGQPKYAPKIAKTIKLHSDGGFSLDFSYFSFHYSDKYSFSQKLVGLLGDPIDPKESHLVTKRAADIAASVQKVTEDVLLHMTGNIQKKTGLPYLCLAGGVALNSVANYRMLENCGFKNIFIQPSPGDSGAAIGAALYAYHHVLGNRKRTLMDNAYLGEKYTNGEIKEFISAVKNNHVYSSSDPDLIGGVEKLARISSRQARTIKFTKMNDNRLIDYISTQISKGKVIGWMQGRFEWGPRALGARSILADPRNPKMKDIINSKVKFREAFRPFAPSVLADEAHKVFELPTTNYQLLTNHFPLRFMLYVVPVRKQWQKKVPAINHADNTARPQLVYEKDNPLYYKLIKSFYKKTGVPLVLNTSFNLRGEPIVSSPADAYSTFIRSGIDILVMGNYVCEKG